MPATPVSGHTRVYPVARADADRRFTLGLVLDVAEVLDRHGYPAVTADNPEDLVELGQALFRFVYAEGGVSA